MVTVTQAESIMMNTTVLKIFLLLYLATRVLATIGHQCNFTSPSLWRTSNSLNITCDSYTLELNSNGITWNITEQFIECNQECCYSIHLQTACDNFGFGGNCTADCGAMNSTDRISPPIDVPTIALATSVPILVVLLGLVTVCWIGTYRTMKKKIRALQSTLTSVNTGNSLTTDTNNEDPHNQQPLCFQNASYEQNSNSFSQSPAPECPETNIYDLPFQTSTGATKEKPKSQEALPKGSIRYKPQETLPKGSIRYTVNKPRSAEPGESKNVCQSTPESPRVNEIEFSCSVNEQQWVPVTEYEVPIAQQETQN